MIDLPFTEKDLKQDCVIYQQSTLSGLMAAIQRIARYICTSADLSYKSFNAQAINLFKCIH